MSLAPYQPQDSGLVHMQAAPPPKTSQVQDLAEWAQAAQAAYEVSRSLVETSFVPEGFRRKPYEATAAILAGSEVGLSPMASLRAYDVIQGTAAPRAITLRAIVQSRGHEVWVEESTDSRAVVAGRRAGSSREQRSVWTIDRARKLKLTGKPNWQSQPDAMLVARATAEVCRLIASDAILGMPYSAEEIADGASPIDAPSQPVAAAEQPATPIRRTARRAPTPPQPRAEEVEYDDRVKRFVTAGPPLPGEDGFDEPAPDTAPSDETPAGDDATKPTAAQNRKMHALFREADITDRSDRLRLTSIVTGRDITTSSGLTRDEASTLIDQLEGWNVDGHLADHVAAILGGDDE